MNYKRTGKIKILKPAAGPDGYLQTMLLHDTGKYKTFKVHKWIAITYHGPVPDGKEVNHKDGIKTNNAASNLEYLTHAQNIQHAFDNGLMKPKRGSLNGMAKLNEQQVREIRAIAKCGHRYYGRKELAEKYGVSQCTIKEVVSIRRGKFADA